jgi:hypothetical protein
MQTNIAGWSATEQTVAQEAFEKAYQREITALLAEVRQQSSAIAAVEDLWTLHDFLSARRHQIDGKYDYNSATLLFTLANLIKEGWLKLDELESLSKDKISKISALTRF